MIRKLSIRATFSTLAVSVLLQAHCFGAPLPRSASNKSRSAELSSKPKSHLTLVQWKQIKIGMTRAQVMHITKSSTLNEHVMPAMGTISEKITVDWVNEDESGAWVEFIHGKVSDKFQNGLK